ncbi:MAG: carbon starvation CstA family protein, partial [Victivallaceae bacterium]
VWLQIPIALGLGYLVYKKNMNATLLGIIAVILMYATIVLGAYFPLKMPSLGFMTLDAAGHGSWSVLFSPVGAWVVLLLIYVYIASTLPVQVLLQPRDFINSYQLFIAMLLLALGIIVAHPEMAAPATNLNVPGSPKMIPMLFVFVACGAISGFHALASSGTTSKQCASEKDALFIGYGSMLTEGMLAVLVIVACGAGIAYGVAGDNHAVFSKYYMSWAAANNLAFQLKAFIDGSTNMMSSIGLPKNIGVTVMGVFIVSFAATSLDSATRIQRYIVAELATLCKLHYLARKHPATSIAVGTAFVIAFSEGSGKGAMSLWPLFGSLNQLLGGLALLVITIYLARKKVNVLYSAIPMVFMLGMTGWAMYYNLIKFAGLEQKDSKPQWMLLVISIIILIFEVWMIIESIVVLYKTYSNNQAAQD